MAKPIDRGAAPRAARDGESEWIATRELEGLLEVMERHEVAELEVVRGSGETRRRLTIRRGRAATAAAAPPAPAPVHAHAGAATPTATATKPAPAASEAEEGFTYVTSPLVGTFYRAPSPESPPFADVGMRIRPGLRLCIVEAMKLMNEIESEIEGTIAEILVENGKPVEYGQKLFKVKI
ncbi:MAG: acetyl-CoA carboxylase biotin carboxyl carrier protein [Deltaproteobacteria bacterium]|nr:acetyl-CoA carboxylase biotin carboxyl carrier protein [Deltaproteobacteria bacterium]